MQVDQSEVPWGGLMGTNALRFNPEDVQQRQFFQYMSHSLGALDGEKDPRKGFYIGTGV